MNCCLPPQVFDELTQTFIISDYVWYRLSLEVCRKRWFKEGNFEAEIKKNGFGDILELSRKRVKRFWMSDKWVEMI